MDKSERIKDIIMPFHGMWKKYFKIHILIKIAQRITQ